MAVPYTFANATAAIPLSQLDSNFSTAITIGNTAVQLGNTITTVNNLTLVNVTVSSGNVTATTVSDAIGNVRDVPQNAQTSAYVLVASDAGKHISITTGGVTVPNGVFTTGQTVTIFNNSASNQTITQATSVTLRQVGTANTGNRTLAQYGLATILCTSANNFVITGGGLT